MPDLYQAMLKAAQQSADATAAVAAAKASGDKVALQKAQEDIARASVTAQVIYNTAMSPQAPTAVQMATANTVLNGGSVLDMNLQSYQTEGLEPNLRASVANKVSTLDKALSSNRAIGDTGQILEMLAKLVDSQQTQDEKLRALTENVTRIWERSQSAGAGRLAFDGSNPIPNLIVEATPDRDIEGIVKLLNDMKEFINEDGTVYDEMTGDYLQDTDERANDVISNRLQWRENNGEYKRYGGLKRVLENLNSPQKAEAARQRISANQKDFQKIIGKIAACGISAVLMVATGNFPLAAMGYFVADGMFDPVAQRTVYNGTMIDNISIDGYPLKPVGLQIPGLPNNIFSKYRFVCYDMLQNKAYPADSIQVLNYQGGVFQYLCLDRLDGSYYHCNKIRIPRIYLD